MEKYIITKLFIRFLKENNFYVNRMYELQKVQYFYDGCIEDFLYHFNLPIKDLFSFSSIWKDNTIIRYKWRLFIERNNIDGNKMTELSDNLSDIPDKILQEFYDLNCHDTFFLTDYAVLKYNMKPYKNTCHYLRCNKKIIDDLFTIKRTNYSSICIRNWLLHLYAKNIKSIAY